MLGLGWKEWTFLIVSTLNILITIGLTIDRLVIVTEDDETSSSDFTFAILILVNACKYAVVLVLHEIFSCNSNSHMRGVSTERILERKSLNFFTITIQQNIVVLTSRITSNIRKHLTKLFAGIDIA